MEKKFERKKEEARNRIRSRIKSYQDMGIIANVLLADMKGSGLDDLRLLEFFGTAEDQKLNLEMMKWLGNFLEIIGVPKTDHGDFLCWDSKTFNLSAPKPM